MKIAVDAMGGDYAPREVVAGCVEASEKLNSVGGIILVGDEQAIKRELGCYSGVSSKIEIRHASEVVSMDETPAGAVRKKKDSSIGRAVDLVKAGEADAVVSAGNTGAAVVACTLKLRLLEGVIRPAIAAVLPTEKNPFVLIDAGANIDCSSRLLAQFGVMGALYSRMILNRNDPVAGLLSIGGEETKGNETTREAYKLLDQSGINFRGNVEGHDLFRGETDVVICDGFVGNIVLKTAESSVGALGHWLKEEFRSSVMSRIGAAFLWKSLKKMKKKADPQTYGGAPLLGVGGVCIITHGSSKAPAIFHAVRVASESIHCNINDLMVEKLKETGLAKNQNLNNMMMDKIKEVAKVR